MSTFKRNALGRGLDALINMDDIKTGGSSSINEIEIARISANPDQPRREFDEEALAELAASIRELGIIQPITLRQIGDSYQIIAGERRYRAAQIAGLSSIPAYVRTVEDETVVEMALIENIQREDLNAIEIALTFQKLIEQYALTQERLSDRIGKKRATIANYLRLLKLPAEVQMGLKNKKIDMGHARALIGISDPAMQLKVYELIVEHGYSVRKVEEMVKLWNNGLTETPEGQPSSKKLSSSKNETLFESLKQDLSHYFKTNVQFTCNQQGKGKISIPFKNEQQLEQIIGLLDKLKE